MSIRNRGFASIKDPEKRRAVASLGGQAARDRHVSHRFTSEEARAAGRKGLAKRLALRDQKPSPKPPSEGEER